ncbi:MAG: pyruvoyl-dependent arginine decarboxylase [Pseudomonadota bacterium]
MQQLQNGQFLPRGVFFTCGKGIAREKLASFEMALRNAGIAEYNLVKVSSIFPAECRILKRREGRRLLMPGQIIFVVMSQNQTCEPNRLLSASIGLAAPADKTHYGYLSEHHSFGQTARKSGDFAEDLAATMLARTLDIDFDPDKNYDERKEIYRMSGRIVESTSITQSARGDTNGRWTTVLASAVFII